MSAVQNEENFLKPQGEASDAVIFQVIMDHQRMRIREALKHEEPQETLDSNVELLLRKSSDIMARQCPNVQQGTRWLDNKARHYVSNYKNN